MHKTLDPPFTPEENSILPVVSSEDLTAPIPPGLWIQAKPHEKAEVLLIRIALFTDKKEPGAAKYSLFYQKHGNPHFGNKKQLVTKATAEKIKARLEQTEIINKEDDKMDESNNEIESEEDEEEEEEEDIETLAKRSGLRMKMRADEEEEKAKSQTITLSSSRKSIWERLDDRGPNRGSVFDRLGARSRTIGRRRNHHDPYFSKRVSVFYRLKDH